MAVSITSFTPNLGHTGGATLVEILGSGFRVATPQSALPHENVPAAPPSMRVLFGAQEATRVIVLSEQRLFAETPMHAEDDVVITCIVIDDDGNTIESAESAEKFAFRRPQLGDNWSLNGITSTLIDRLKLVLHPNISLHHDPDYSSEDDDVTAFIVDLADLPSIAIVGPELTENRFYSLNTLDKTSISDAESLERRERKTVDLGFELIGFSDNKSELSALMEATIEIFHKLKALPHPNDPSTLVEVDLIDLPKPSKVANDAGLSMFRCEVLIRGFDLYGLPRFQRDLTTDYIHRSLDSDDAVQLTNTDQLAPRSTSPLGGGIPLTTPARRPADLRGRLSYPSFGSIPARPRKSR